ncbi:MAG: flagellar biosynthesis regulator FlaF [Bdellovibrionales bacterium]
MSPNPYEKISIYGKNQKVQSVSADNSRDTDARALLACASKLNDAKELMSSDVKSKKYLKIYGDALRKNQRLWTIFQVALTDPENQLPMPLKITLLNLGRYVDKTSFSAMSKFTPSLVDSLININRIIASGLSKQPEKSNIVSSQTSDPNNPSSLMTSA